MTGLSTTNPISAAPGWMGKARMAGKYLGPVGSVVGAGFDYTDGKAQGEDDIRAAAGAAGSTAGGVIGGVLGTALGPVGSIAGSVVGSTVGGWLGDRADELVRGNTGMSGANANANNNPADVAANQIQQGGQLAIDPVIAQQLNARRQQDLARSYY